jgi:hypothetical protein
MDKAVVQPFDDYNVTIKVGDFVTVTTLLLLHHRVREKRWLFTRIVPAAFMPLVLSNPSI